MSDLVSHSSRVKINDAPTASGDNIFYCCPFYSSIRNSSFRKKKISEMFYGWDVPESGPALIQGQCSPTPHCSVLFFCHLESILKPSKYIKKSARSRLAELIFMSGEIQYLASSLKNDCDNLFLEGSLCLLKVKDLAIHACRRMPTEVLWQDEIIYLSSVPAGHWSKPKQNCYIIRQCCDWFCISLCFFWGF